MIAYLFTFGLALTSVLAPGKLITGSVPKGFHAIDASHVDAKETIEAGGIVVTETSPGKGAATFYATPQEHFSGLPEVPGVCSGAGGAMATSVSGKMTASKVVPFGKGRACRIDIDVAGEKPYQARTFLWFVSPAEKLAGMAMCTHGAGDSAMMKLCQEFAESIKATNP